MKKDKHIMMTGGGTGGSVTPLLAVAGYLADNGDGFEFSWIGTKDGPEKKMVENRHIPFSYIRCGKFRRYFSLYNFFDIFNFIVGAVQSFLILNSRKPDLIMSAGGFVSVPLVWAAWIMRVPVFIHQQDIRPGLANKLMSPLASVITVSFEKSLNDYGAKAVWTGNPVRAEFRERMKNSSKDKGFEAFGLKTTMPVLLVVGGGTGSAAINSLVANALPDLSRYMQVIHVTGGKKSNQGALRWVDKGNSENYRHYEFLEEYMISQALHIASAVVSRCGMGFLTELSFLEKAAILIPLPGTHQADNAELFKSKEAALVYEESSLDSSEFCKHVKRLLADDDFRARLQVNIGKLMKKDAEKNIGDLVKSYF